MITYSNLYSHVNEQELKRKHILLQPVINIFTDVLKDEYSTPYGFINVPFDQDISEQVQNCIDRKKEQSPSTCIVIGIGGSMLGTRALYQALQYQGLHKRHATLCFIDTLDSEKLAHVSVLIERLLQSNQSVVINLVSKSGTTLETLANFQVVAHCMQRYCPLTYKKSIVISTDQGSPLWKWGEQEGIDLLPIPKQVGGRYSVFSAASLFPLGLAGINIDQLLEGARQVTSSCVRDDQDNYAAQLAINIYEWYTQGFPILDLFFFLPEFEYLGQWLRQLIAESVGKKETMEGKEARIGLLPTVSMGSADLHAVGQRYFGGAHTIGTIFYTSAHVANTVVIPPLPLPNSLIHDLVGKDVHTLLNVIAQGTQRAYADQKMPYVHIELSEITPYYVGQLLQLHMMSVVYLAHLLHVNAFDQPEVERYKHETKELLDHHE